MRANPFSALSAVGGLLNSSRLTKMGPQPQSKVGQVFSRVFQNIRSLAGGVESVTMDISPEYAALIEKQMEMQQQIQNVSMLSNIEKSKHESRMAAIRNIRSA
ncbi:MAG: hypothetical protein D6719_09915 [Candidatus Dadabacteria bacterium]|nr:MAG: hypothetical protein D6719_09915 [Candidatus Dadabacteria bacterium]